MVEITDEMVEVGALAAINAVRAPGGWPQLTSIPDDFRDADRWRLEARAALSAVAPMIAAAEREACARVAEGFPANRSWVPESLWGKLRSEVSAAIRARGTPEETA